MATLHTSAPLMLVVQCQVRCCRAGADALRSTITPVTHAAEIQPTPSTTDQASKVGYARSTGAAPTGEELIATSTQPQSPPLPGTPTISRGSTEREELAALKGVILNKVTWLIMTPTSPPECRELPLNGTVLPGCSSARRITMVARQDPPVRDRCLRRTG